VNKSRLLFNLCGTLGELMTEEIVARILDELDKSDQETPWMRTMNDYSFQQDSKTHKIRPR